MDNTCPELTKVDQTSDYGSNDSCQSSTIEAEAITGFCPGSGDGSRYFVHVGRCIYWKTGESLDLVDEFPSEVRNIVNFDNTILLVLTADGLYEMNMLQIHLRAPRPLYAALMQGAFFGLDVMGEGTEFPIILTTTKTEHCCYLEMRDYYERCEIISKIPLSCISSTILARSSVTKVNVDACNNVVYVSDQGCQMLLKVSLDDCSCLSFGWKRCYTGPGRFTFAITAGDRVLAFTDHSFFIFLSDGTPDESVLLDNNPVCDAVFLMGKLMVADNTGNIVDLAF